MIGLLGQVLIYIVPFLLVLTFIVTVHELGHFLTARAFGVKIEQFSIGFGRALASRRDRHGVEWRIGWLPFGGYVKFAGDLDGSGVPDRAGLEAFKQRITTQEGPGAEKAYLFFKPVWQRALVTVAGPLANFLLAIVIFTLLFTFIGVELRPARVVQIQPDSPAAAAGFLPGDLITGVNGKTISDGAEVTRVVALSSGDPVRFTVERGDRRVQLVATPERRVEDDPVAGRIAIGRIGLALGSSAAEVRRIRYSLPEAVLQGVRQTGEVIGTTVTYIGRIFRGRESGDQFSGPLGIAKASGALTNAAVSANPAPGAMAANLLLTFVSFAAILSIGIGFLNLLPIPILDGGHLLFYAYEAVARRPLSAGVQEAGYRAGLALLAGLMLFATWNDLQKLNLFKFLGGLVS